MALIQATKDSLASARADAVRREFSLRLARADRATYVYTYPFKGAYRPRNSAECALGSWRRASGPLNIYVHIPYCEMKCSFCNLFTTTRRSRGTRARYVEALVEEIRMFANHVDVRRYQVESIYFGGGTPILLSDDALSEIVGALHEVFRVSADAEISIELAPNSVDESRFPALLKLGFGRVSIGIQSFHQRELQTMGRPYPAELGSRLTFAALAAGFKNVNVDLIYGLPAQDEQTWVENLTTAVNLGVPTITIYPLTLRSRTRFGRGYEQAPNEFLTGRAVYALYDIAVETLYSNGHRQLTAAVFAKKGGGNRHEENEFSGKPTLGFGAAALSYAPNIHYTSGDYLDARPSGEIITEYIEAVRRSQLPIRSSILIDDDESRRRHVILRLLYSGLDKTEYRNRFGECVTDRFDAEIDALRLENCIEQTGERIVLSRRGRRFSSLIADLFASEPVKRLSASYS